MTTKKQIDKVFLFIKSKVDLEVRISSNYIWNLYINKSPEFKISKSLFEEILFKLDKDGYFRTDGDGMYWLSIEGRDFKGYVSSSKWWNQITKKNIIEGVIYTLIATALIWAIAKGYNMMFGEKIKDKKEQNIPN